MEKAISALEENIKLRGKAIDLDKFWPWIPPPTSPICISLLYPLLRVSRIETCHRGA